MRAKPDGGPGADAREPVLDLLQGADRAGAARRARPAGDAARHGRGRSDVRAAWRAGLADVDRPEAERPVGRAGHRRRDQGRQPLRHLLGRGARGDGGSPAACRHRARRCCCCPSVDRLLAASVRSLSPDEAALWARVTATITPLSRGAAVRPPASRRRRKQRPRLPAAERPPGRGRVPPPRRQPAAPARPAPPSTAISTAIGTAAEERQRPGPTAPRPSRPQPRARLDALDAALERAVAAATACCC
jgi:hypothetical protein